jgi:hypothetical protein
MNSKTYFNKNLSETIFKHLNIYINVERVLTRKLEFKRTSYEYSFIIKELYETRLIISVLEKIISRHESASSFSALVRKTHVWFYNILNGKSIMSTEDMNIFNKFINNKFDEM